MTVGEWWVCLSNDNMRNLGGRWFQKLRCSEGYKSFGEVEASSDLGNGGE